MNLAVDERALHQRISLDLEANIRSGAWPPGFRIPFEHELTAQYGCARATVNKAVSALVAAGLIERRRRAGSFVARPHLQSAVLEIPDIQADALVQRALVDLPDGAHADSTLVSVWR